MCYCHRGSEQTERYLFFYETNCIITLNDESAVDAPDRTMSLVKSGMNFYYLTRSMTCVWYPAKFV